MSNSVNYGVWYDFRNPAAWHQAFEAFYTERLEQITQAEKLGFNSCWLTEHHFCEDGYTPSPLVLAAAIGARTQKMRLGTNLMLLPLHDPVRVRYQGKLQAFRGLEALALAFRHLDGATLTMSGYGPLEERLKLLAVFVVNTPTNCAQARQSLLHGPKLLHQHRDMALLEDGVLVSHHHVACSQCICLAIKPVDRSCYTGVSALGHKPNTSF